MTARGIPAARGQFEFDDISTFTERGLLAKVGQAARRQPFYAAAALLLLAMVGTALLGPLLPLADPQTQALSDRLLPPMARGADGTLYIAGTDNLGRDTLARAVQGARLSIGIAAAAALIAGVIGTAIGVIAAYRGGFVDMLIMRMVDLQMAFPGMVLAIFLLYILGSTVTNLVLLLVIFSWAVFARMARAQTLSLRNQAFVEGAVAVGANDTRIIVRHIIPHLIPVMAIIGVFDFAGVMLAEAGLSFLGLGVQPPGISWGLMISQGREFINTGGWWLVIIPGLALSLTCLAANLTSRWIQMLTRIQE
jgi:ABC-type dipeptide/oligopeptide/nickel transport system permease subunit